MSIFFWKKNKIIDVFANELANDFYSHVDSEKVRLYFGKGLKGKEHKKDKKKLETNLLNLTKQIQQFRITNELGTYGKARFQLKFNSRLQELGYEESTVKKLSDYILVQIP